MRNVLIFGGSGFLGVHLLQRCLQEDGVQITVVDIHNPLNHPGLQGFAHRIHFIPGSILDESLLNQAIQDQEIIFQCAAQTSHILSLQNPILDAEVNVLGNLRILEAVRLYNPQAVLVYPSTTTVIGRATEEIIDESHPELPLEIYSANKSVAEKYYAIYHRIHGLKTLAFRLGNLYGPYGKPRPEYGMTNYFIYRAWHNRDLTVYGNGDQLRNLTFVEDAAAMLWEMAHTSIFGEICFATSPFHHTILEVAETITQVFGRGRVIQVPWPPDRKRIEIGPVHFSAEKLHALTGFKMNHDLAAGLEKTREILESAGEAVFTPHHEPRL